MCEDGGQGMGGNLRTQLQKTAEAQIHMMQACLHVLGHEEELILQMQVEKIISGYVYNKPSMIRYEVYRKVPGLLLL
jgi:hypothetical protein